MEWAAGSGGGGFHPTSGTPSSPCPRCERFSAGRRPEGSSWLLRFRRYCRRCCYRTLLSIVGVYWWWWCRCCSFCWCSSCWCSSCCCCWCCRGLSDQFPRWSPVLTTRRIFFPHPLFFFNATAVPRQVKKFDTLRRLLNTQPFPESVMIFVNDPIQV